MDVLDGVPVDRLKIMIRTGARAIEGLRAENVKLREALAWYADAQNYAAPIGERDTTEPVFFDNGERARAALR